MGNDEQSLELCEKEIEMYTQYFDKVIRDSFAKKFIYAYFECNGFHDWILQSVQTNIDGNKNTVLVTLYNDYTKWERTIKYWNVQSFRFDFSEEHFQDIYHDPFGIDEFYKISDKLFSHEVYCPSGSNYSVEFQKITIE